jgi:serine/threonine-protein kinase
MAETSQTPNPGGRDDSESGEVAELVGRAIDDRYRLEEYLGGGGMAEVYRAQHTLMQKTVAVKLLRPEVAEDESIIERFRREAAAAANLEHPNICSATDFGKTDEGHFYLVMEYVDGPSLQDVLDERGALPVEEAAAVADEIAAALEQAEQLDVVHRDIKPDNVMLVDDGGAVPEVRIVDFGIAHVEFNDQMPSLTKTGAVFGTPNYMSPEQATGDEVDHRSDLYGVGVVLFEMLTGREVFDEEESAQLMAAHITQQPELPSEVRPETRIPTELDELVMELLSKKPEGRPASASAVRQRLRRFTVGADQSGERPTAEPASASRASSRAPSTLEVTTRRIREWAADLDIDGFEDHSLNLALVALAVFLGLVLFGLVVASVVVLNSGSPEETRNSLEAERAAYKKREEVATALEPLENGRPADAVRNLEGLREERGDSASPHLHFVVGEAYDRIGNESKALEAFRAAAASDRDYLYDHTVLDVLEEAFEARSSELTDAAAAFVGEF